MPLDDGRWDCRDSSQKRPPATPHTPSRVARGGPSRRPPFQPRDFPRPTGPPPRGEQPIIAANLQFRFQFHEVPADEIVRMDALVIEEAGEVGSLALVDADDDVAAV